MCKATWSLDLSWEWETVRNQWDSERCLMAPNTWAAPNPRLSLLHINACVKLHKLEKGINFSSVKFYSENLRYFDYFGTLTFSPAFWAVVCLCFSQCICLTIISCFVPVWAKWDCYLFPPYTFTPYTPAVPQQICNWKTVHCILFKCLSLSGLS